MLVVGYHLNNLDEPVFMAVSKPMLTEIGIHFDRRVVNTIKAKLKCNLLYLIKVHVGSYHRAQNIMYIPEVSKTKT